MLSFNDLQSNCEAGRCQWNLNFPHASNFGGPSELKIGAVRRILEACFLKLNHRMLPRDEFASFLSEAIAIVNSNPLWEVSCDPNDPRPQGHLSVWFL